MLILNQPLRSDFFEDLAGIVFDGCVGIMSGLPSRITIPLLSSNKSLFISSAMFFNSSVAKCLECCVTHISICVEWRVSGEQKKLYWFKSLISYEKPSIPQQEESLHMILWISSKYSDIALFLSSRFWINSFEFLICSACSWKDCFTSLGTFFHSSRYQRLASWNLIVCGSSKT